MSQKGQKRFATSLFITTALALALAAPSIAQPNTPAPDTGQTTGGPTGTGPQTTEPTAPPAPSEPILTLEPTIITAEKRAENLQDAPASITVVDTRAIDPSGQSQVREAAELVPNLTYSYFTAARLSFPFVRGIGSGRNNPAVTTYIDGVPQLSFSTSNLNIVDVERFEFLRGPQGTLYGRNTIGGVINIVSRKPSNDFFFEPQVTFGNYSLQDYRFTLGGPIVPDNLFVSVSGGFLTRQGYTINRVSGHDLDDREEEFGRVSLRWTPSADTEVIFTTLGERDRDGDFGLYDLGSLRHDDHRLRHDFEGFTNRDVLEPSLTLNHHFGDADLTSISSFVYWKIQEVTDLDETPLALFRRDNGEDQRYFTEELRLASPTDRPLTLGEDVKVSWLVGGFFFSSMSDQRTAQAASAFGASFQGVPVAFTSFQSGDFGDVGAAVYGQGTLTFFDKLDLTVGLRYEFEHKEADLGTSTSPALAPSTFVSPSKDFDHVSPRFVLGYHWTRDILTYGSAAEGFKAGGFNVTSPAANVAFDPETSWTYEAGVKTAWLNNRVIVNADVFYIDWQDLQLDVPIPFQPAQFYIDKAGKAYSEGAELEVTVRPVDGLDLFAGLGYDRAHFGRGSMSGGLDVGGNALPFAPETTWNAGAQYTHRVANGITGYVRGEVIGTGKYFYDASNAAAQDTFVLTNFRLGVRGDHWHLDGWIRNAFNEQYIPLAFPFPGSASGYVGESGDPRTYGVTFGLEF